MMLPNQLWPQIRLESWASTDGLPLPYGVVRACQARIEMPSTSVPSVLDIHTIDLRALPPVGLRKTDTPLEIASSPVSDEPPFANAFSKPMVAAKVSRLCVSWP